MNPHPQAWQKLAAAARAHRDERPVDAPYGFATQIAARAFAAPGLEGRSQLEKFALRGLIAACALGLAATTFGVVSGPSDEAELVAGDVVAEILERS